MPGWQELSLGLGVCRVTVPDSWRLERADDKVGRLLLPSGRGVDYVVACHALPEAVGQRELLELMPEAKAVPGFGWQHVGAGAFRVTVRSQVDGGPRLMFVTTSRVAERHLRVVRFLPDRRARETEPELVRTWSNFGDMVRNAWFNDQVTLGDRIAAEPDSPWQRMIMGGRLHLRVPREWPVTSPGPYLWVFRAPSGAELRVALQESAVTPGEPVEQVLNEVLEGLLNEQPGELAAPATYDRTGFWLRLRDGGVERCYRIGIDGGRLTRATFELPAQPGEAVPAQLRAEILLAVIEDAPYALAQESLVRRP